MTATIAAYVLVVFIMITSVMFTVLAISAWIVPHDRFVRRRAVIYTLLATLFWTAWFAPMPFAGAALVLGMAGLVVVAVHRFASLNG